MNRYDMWRNLHSKNTTPELQEIYNAYIRQKSATVNIAARFDGKGLEKQIIRAFENTGARVIL